MATITVALMDPPYESETTTTAFRILDAAIRKGHTVNVFAYEGAVNLSMAQQVPHPNPARGTSVEDEDHPLSKDWVSALFAAAGDRLDWINCGLCVDERGAGDWVDGPRRGGPGDFVSWVAESDQTLVIPTK